MEKQYIKELIAIIEPDGSFCLDWESTNDEIDTMTYGIKENLYRQYLADSGMFLLLLGTSLKTVKYHETLEFLRKISQLFILSLTRNPDIEILREEIKIIPEEDEIDEIITATPFIIGWEYVNKSWIEKIYQILNDAFKKEIMKYQGKVAEYFINKNQDIHFAGRVYFHLVENKQEEFPFAFMATYASIAVNSGKSRHLPLKNALQEYGENSSKLLELLSTVNKAASSSEFISELIDSGDIFHPIGLNPEEAYIFLKEVSIYEEAGVLCRIPNWWRKKGQTVKLGVNIGTKPPALVGKDALLDFNIQLYIDGENITAEELRSLSSQTDGLAFIKGKWVEVDKKRLMETLEAYEKAKAQMGNGNFTLADAMRFELSASKVLGVDGEHNEIEISNGEWLKSVLSRMQKPEVNESLDPGNNFKATLREYQKKGLNWLYTMKEIGFGACLADDMGLGKTIQIIALLNHILTKCKEKILIVVPASLIGNWTDEIRKFAPDLCFEVIHPQENKAGGMIQAAKDINTSEKSVFISTYGMVLRLDWLKDVDWDLIILDEAQAIKNAGTKQTKAVKQLKAKSRIAMTGTPVENRLSDLWSIFDFLNQGLLGTAKEFIEFSRRLKENAAGYGKLKQVVSPFILRRMKTDKSIISDLPDKIEMKIYAGLSKKQAALYGKLVSDLEKQLAFADGISRKGLVLAALMKFKQICNHPDQYLGQQVYEESESGKYQQLREICETIYENRERVIVFTQFKEITQHIADFLETVFQHKGLVLHGETPVHRRKEIVAKFQGQEYIPFMVLSIKAGGVGLNLTAANHVVHFDRWWNPAIENQATDRAFRIGQKKNVLVHKFITKGTIEEKIDKMIEEKIKLTNEVVSDMNESWITEMGNQEIIKLFKLE